MNTGLVPLEHKPKQANTSKPTTDAWRLASVYKIEQKSGVNSQLLYSKWSRRRRVRASVSFRRKTCPVDGAQRWLWLQNRLRSSTDSDQLISAGEHRRERDHWVYFYSYVCYLPWLLQNIERHFLRAYASKPVFAIFGTLKMLTDHKFQVNLCTACIPWLKTLGLLPAKANFVFALLQLDGQ